MGDSLQDWYESQLGQPEECWQALADQRQTSDLSTSVEPPYTLADFDAFLREGFAESDRSLGIGDPLGLHLPTRYSPDVLESERLETSASDPKPASAPLRSAGSAPVSKPHATATWEPLETARTSSGPSSTSLKKLLQGRESQRRFREKQKVHSLHEGVALHTYMCQERGIRHTKCSKISSRNAGLQAKSQAQQTELVRAQTELARTKARQTELESRNLILESLTKMNRDSEAASPSALAVEGPRQGMFTAAELHIHNSQMPVQISVYGRKDSITPQQIRQFTLSAFSKLWTDYMRELASCLLQAKDNATTDRTADTAFARLQQLTCEASALMARMLLDVKMHNALIHGRMDTGSPTTNQLDKPFYQNLVAAMALSDAQMSDVMLLRALYHSKLGALGRERDKLIQQLAQNEQGSVHPTEALVNASCWTAELRANASEEHQTHYRIALAVYTGVLNTKQRAELMVLCYPYMSILRTLLDTCASAEEPTFEQLTAITEPTFMQQEWHHFTEYIQAVTSKTFQQMNHDYLPFQH